MRNKKKIVVGFFILGLALLGSMVLGYRIFEINEKYPNPELIKYQIGDEVLLETNTKIKVKEGNFYSLKVICELFPEYDFENENEYIEESSIKFFIVKLEILDDMDYKKTGALNNLILQSGAWSNGWDLELFYIMNQSEQIKDYIYLPYFLYDFQFNNKEWEKVEERNFCLITSVYPKKTLIELK